jgi:hypothetical protein
MHTRKGCDMMLAIKNDFQIIETSHDKIVIKEKIYF